MVNDEDKGLFAEGGKVEPRSEYYFIEGCFITELFNTSYDDAVSIAQVRVLPGATTRWHYLVGVVERYVILKGRGLVEVGNLPPQEVCEGDVVVIPPMIRQRIKNLGADNLIFLAVCTPRFTPDCYRDIDPEPISVG
jgi:mannose-6-phosphate isomerase-like protein (cupin superfamily)